MKIVYDDGGRSKYFKGKHVGDCVTRAIAIATGFDYKEVYNTIKDLTNQTPRNGVSKKATKDIMNYYGFNWVPTMMVGSGCNTHLREDELPDGIIICNLSGHVVCVIDGVIHDTFDPSRGGKRCVYGYWYIDKDGE